MVFGCSRAIKSNGEETRFSRGPSCRPPVKMARGPVGRVPGRSGGVPPRNEVSLESRFVFAQEVPVIVENLPREQKKNIKNIPRGSITGNSGRYLKTYPPHPTPRDPFLFYFYFFLMVGYIVH